jgi:hypothetical protein
MDTRIIPVYCLCDDLLKAMGHHLDSPHQVSITDRLDKTVHSKAVHMENLK